MSCVSLNLGQCGTQIGHQLLGNLHKEATDPNHHHDPQYKSAALDTYFRENPKTKKHESRCVMVDMEPKAVGKILARDSALEWRHPEGGQFCYGSGAGNNWAHGYKKLGPRFCEVVMEMVAREVEKCDSLDGFLVSMSVAGGTGSGAGSFYLNELRDRYPRSSIATPHVLPYNDGEVAVQCYNAALSLANMSVTSSACISLDNNELHDACKNQLGVEKVSFGDINKLASEQLSSVLLPSESVSGWVKYRKHKMADFVFDTTAGSQYKFLNIISTPVIPRKSVKFETFEWKSLACDLKRRLRRKSTNCHGDDKYFSLLVSLRGLGARECDISSQLGFSSDTFASFSGSDALKVWKCQRGVQGLEKSISCVTNSRSNVENFGEICRKSWKLFNSKSYVHQYYRHGLEEEDFKNSILSLQSVVSNYNYL